MKRLLDFLLIGPLLGYVVFILRNIAGGKLIDGMIGFLFGLPFAYLFGLPIALLVWAEDAWLWNKIGLWPKAVSSAITGYAASIAMLMVLATRQLSVREILTFGIVGAVPAAVCSLLARYEKNATT
jgi:hypothetical protein